MAISTYTTTLTDLMVGAGDKANATALGGGAAGLNDETDYFIQGTGCITKNAWAGAKKGFIYNTAADRAATVGTDGAFLVWCTHATPNSVDLIANGGIDLVVGSSASDYKHWYVGGGDTIEFMGWIIAAVNPSETTDEADTGTPTAVESYVGVLWDLPVGGPTKGSPAAMDGVRVGRGDLIYELGTSTDPDASFSLAVADKGDVTDRLGLIQERSGAFFLSGLHQLGDNASDVVNFTDSDKTLFWNDHPAVTAPFNTLDIQNATSTVAMTNISWKALGTKSPGTWTTSQNATVDLTTCNFIGWGTFGFGTNSTILGCTFLSCAQVTHAGSIMNGSSILTSTVAADTGALLYNLAADPDGEMDNMSFSKGTNAHHAIDFGTSVTSDITLRGMEFTGFGTTEDGNDAALRFLATTGSLNCNIVGCTVDGATATASNLFKDDAAGILVTLVFDPITYTITVRDNAGDALQNANVYLAAEDATGDLAFNATISSITRSTTTATVTHAAPHGLTSGNYVNLTGITDNTDDNSGCHQVTVTNTTVYTYITADAGSTNYTGTITGTGVLLYGLTDVSGVISGSRTLGSDQNVKGYIRKSTTSPRFKSFSLAGNVVSSTLGLNLNIRMILDE